MSKKQVRKAAGNPEASLNFRSYEELRSQLATIVESSDDAIIGKTLEGIITSWNFGAEKIYGYTAKEVIGRSISILTPSDLPDDVPQILEKIRRGEHIANYETIRMRKDGRRINVFLSISPIKNVDGKTTGASTIARDITDQKRSDGELRESEHALRERVKELTCLYNLAKLAEKPEISLKNLLQGIVGLLPPAWQYPEITSGRITLDKKTYVSTGFKNGKDILSSDILINGDNRGIVEVIYAREMPELDEGPFLQEERNLIDAVAKQIAIIVERKQTEEDKARLQEQLRHADRLATIGQLSAGVAHELNEPIGGILGFAQLIAKYPNLPGQVKQDIEKITKASLHAREVVKKLMIFARQMPPQKTHINLNQVVEEGLYFLESRCAKEGIEVVRNLSPNLPRIIADPSQITQVLVNIVVNAIQAMPGGGTLKIKTEISGKNVKLTIEDTGIGMDEKVKQKIFLPFFTTKDIGEGTGIGMAVVHGIITAHGGSIEVESEPGYGTKVEVKLPEAKM